MLIAITRVVGGVLGALRSYIIGRDIGSLSQAIQALGDYVSWYSRLSADVFDAAKGAEDFTQGEADDAGRRIELVGYNLKQITLHTYQTVLPRTVKWVVGYVFSTGIVPLRRDVDTLRKQVRFLDGWRGQIDSWRKHWVDPNIAGWRAFHTWFDGWPRGVLLTWHDWLAHPHRFGVWAAPPITGPLVAYLATPEHRKSRDALTTVIVDASPDVWRHLERAAVHFLDTEVGK